MLPPAETLQNFFGVFLQFQIGVDKEMQDALRDIFGPMFEAMLQGEMEGHLGSPSSSGSMLPHASKRQRLNSSFRKVTKKGAFPCEDAVLKALYLRLSELYKNWADRPAPVWAMVRNQLSMDDKIQARIMKYENF